MDDQEEDKMNQRDQNQSGSKSGRDAGNQKKPEDKNLRGNKDSESSEFSKSNNKDGGMCS